MTNSDAGLIGESGGVSEPIWRLQLNSAPSFSGGRIYHKGVEVGNKPMHQHCTSEGYYDG